LIVGFYPHGILSSSKFRTFALTPIHTNIKDETPDFVGQGKNTLNFLCDLFPLARPSSAMLSYELPPTESVAPIRANMHGLVTTAPNRLVVLRQSPTMAVLPDVRMPIIYEKHKF
jgi:hypothetical protein